MTSPAPDPTDTLHEWVSFENDGTTWIFDVTFLTSNWACIWDDGCLGIRSEPTPEQAQGCCSFGAHFSDDGDLERVRSAAARLTPAQWQMHDQAPNPFARDDEGTWHTVLVDGACVFLNRPGYEGGHGCALHRGALEAAEPIRDWKPDVCWQLPLRLEHHEDENGHAVATLRQWNRHDWGDGGSEFHWWCTEDHHAFVEHTPVYERLSDEISWLVGDELTGLLTDYLVRRGRETLLPHPAIRPRS